MIHINRFEKEVLKFVSQHLNDGDLLHTLGVVNQVKSLLKKESLSERDTEILVLSAYFHDYTKRDGSVKEHHLTSAKVSEEYLKGKGYPYILDVVSVIKSHSFPIKRFHDKDIENPRPSTKLQLLLIKADMLEQLEPSGISRIFVKNMKKGLSFDENLKDIKETVLEAEENLKWTKDMLQNI